MIKETKEGVYMPCNHFLTHNIDIYIYIYIYIKGGTSTKEIN